MVKYDLVVIGAGPAGMAAATEAANSGAKVALIDEQQRPGGQIYRNVGAAVLKDQQVLGTDYYYGKGLVDSLDQAPLEQIFSATVWEINRDNLCLSINGESRRIGFKKLLIATGAQERPVPFPGWTLPGVMTCGAAQILLKTSGLAPESPVVIAGSGPMLV